jgi:hypothetical protein
MSRSTCSSPSATPRRPAAEAGTRWPAPRSRGEVVAMLKEIAFALHCTRSMGQAVPQPPTCPLVAHGARSRSGDFSPGSAEGGER